MLEIDIEKEPHLELSRESWEIIYIGHGWVKEDGLTNTKLKNPHFINPKGNKRTLYIEDMDNIDNWKRMDLRTRTSETLLKLFKEASFDLSLLDRHKTLYQHEGFLILLGLCPNIETKYIWQWDLNATFFRNENGVIEKGGLGESGRDYDEWNWVEREFKTKKRPLGMEERRYMTEEQHYNHICVPIEINKEQFIEWAKGLGYIKESTALRDVEESPFKVEFSKMLYDQLIEKECINGDFEGKWIWRKEIGAYSYLVRMLHANQIPIDYHTSKAKKQIRWTNLQHYIHVDYSGHPKDYKTTSEEADIEEVVTHLLEGYNNTDRRYLKYP